MKKFSIVTIFGNTVEEDEEIFLPGFCEIEDLSDSSVFFDIMSEISSSDTVDIEIEHCYLLDKPHLDGELLGKVYAKDMTDDEIENLLEDFDKLLEEDMIYCECSIEFDLEGLNDDEVLIEESIEFEETEIENKVDLEK